MKNLVLGIMMVLFSVVTVNSQNKKKDSIKGKVFVLGDTKGNFLVKLKEGANPMIYVDGKKFDFSIELIDQTQIASVMVVKGEEALKKYKAPNGVILIQTKKASKNYFSDKTITEDNKIGGKNGPMVIVDGKVKDERYIKQLTPSDIKSMEILKGEKALKRYNAPNGVILITTKKR